MSVAPGESHDEAMADIDEMLRSGEVSDNIRELVTMTCPADPRCELCASRDWHPLSVVRTRTHHREGGFTESVTVHPLGMGPIYGTFFVSKRDVTDDKHAVQIRQADMWQQIGVNLGKVFGCLDEQ